MIKLVSTRLRNALGSLRAETQPSAPPAHQLKASAGHPGGLLVQSNGPIFGNKVFYLRRGHRHWMTSAELIRGIGFRYPEDVQTVSDELLLTYLPGQQVPAKRSPPLKRSGIPSVGEARETAASQLKGIGLEIGAHASPFPAPLECVVQYGDMYNYEELLENAYTGQSLHDIVVPTLKTDLDTLQGVADDSLDFLIACHVIEHTRDPIGAITRAYSKLHEGGSLTLVVPDMERTFDRDRDRTTLAHLIEDFSEPSRERDKAHFQEFYSKAPGFIASPETFEQTWKSNWEATFPIHYHTWNYDSFGEMIEWTLKNAAPYREVWSHPTVPDGIEFYFTLTR